MLLWLDSSVLLLTVATLKLNQTNDRRTEIDVGGGSGRHWALGVGAIRCSGLDKDRQTVRRRDAQDAYRSMSGRRGDGLLRILPAEPPAVARTRRDGILIIEDLPPPGSNICVHSLNDGGAA